MIITVNFANLLDELKEKSLQIVILHNRNSFFLEDKKRNLYTINNTLENTYLDKAIRDKKLIDFRLVNSHTVKEWEKEKWSIENTSQFIKSSICG